MGLPFPLTKAALGLIREVVLVCFLESIIIIFDNPVASSICSVTVTPSTKSSNFMIPAASATIGCVCGSHVEIRSPAFTFCPSLMVMIAPYGTL